MRLDYSETNDALSIRIEAHKRYSSLRIEDVLERILLQRHRNLILDIGCGSGNYSEIFAKYCSFYIGLDKNFELLKQANIISLSNISFIKFDMDKPFPLVDECCDLIFYGYSVYYSNDLAFLIRESKNTLNNYGLMLIVGPVAGNAVELDEVSYSLFGVSSSNEKDIRINRLEENVVPLIKSEFKECEIVQHDFSLIFPDIDEYLKYYLATPQYIELANRFGKRDIEVVKTEIDRLTNLILTKKSLFIYAYK